ncbi:MAG: hypothetical protein PHI23_00585 [Candidatus Peribacteraceae bacterium]|nr:hypothetical protein [Candidatus Peribacteraceae bacterium]
MPSCTQCSSAFDITQDDLAFYDKVSPVFNGKKELIPPPTLCPDCRQQRRLAFRNAHVLYKRKCDLTGQMIVSTASPDKPYKVYNHDGWWSDVWDPMMYGRPFDPARSFFDQLHELQCTVPRLALGNWNSENSDYVAIGADNRNCYMASPCFRSEDCYFGDSIYSCKNTIDCLLCEGMEIAYECTNCKNGYALFYSQNSLNCWNSWFLKDCNSCSDCIGCYGLRNQRFHVFNKPVTETEYKKILMQLLKPLTHKKIDDLRGSFLEMELRLPHVSIHETLSENCTGNEFIECRNCFESYDLKRCEDVKHCYRVFDAKDSYDLSKCGVEGLEHCYELMNAGYSNNHVLFSHVLQNSADVYYCEHCFSCKNCFGCSGLRHKSYCLLNKQYSREEYEKLVPQIIAHMRNTGEWGEFFPVPSSPFAYNETVAQEYFPLTKEEAERRGWNWHQDVDSTKQYLGPDISIPDSVFDVPEDVTSHILRCSATGTLYKIIPQELAFLKGNGIPLPLKCPDQRHKERMALRNPRKLWSRNCAKCGKGIQTTYAPERPAVRGSEEPSGSRGEIVYCESCYLATVY